MNETIVAYLIYTAGIGVIGKFLPNPKENLQKPKIKIVGASDFELGTHNKKNKYKREKRLKRSKKNGKQF